MNKIPNCIKCNCSYVYEYQSLLICPECNFEWNPIHENEKNIIRDINGNELNNGDDVILAETLKVKGSSKALKVGTKVKNIRLRPDNTDGHDIDCKIDGFGAMLLKSSKVKKA